jgi:hypothetical protein
MVLLMTMGDAGSGAACEDRSSFCSEDGRGGIPAVHGGTS